jgi:hypothetical protein
MPLTPTLSQREKGISLAAEVVEHDVFALDS